MSSTPLHLTRGEAHTHRYQSTLDAEPFSQADRTLVLTIWRKWGRPGQHVVLEVVSSDEETDARLVALEWEQDEEENPDVGAWEIRLTGPEAAMLEAGMHHYCVWSIDAEAEDPRVLVGISQLYAAESGRDD